MRRLTEDDKLKSNNMHDDILNLTQRQLEKICHQNYCPHNVDPRGVRRRALIQAGFNSKIQGFVQRRDIALEKATTKYEKDSLQAQTDRNDDLTALEKDVEEFHMKRKAFLPAFNQLQVRCCPSGCANPKIISSCYELAKV